MVNPERTAWGAPVALAVLAATLSLVVNAALLLFLPLALLLLALPPRRPALMAFGLFLLIVGLTGPAVSPMWWLGRGWALVLGAWFVGVLAVRPEGGFINRGLAALVGAGASATALIALDRTAWQQADREVAQVLQEGVASTLERLGPQLAGREVMGGRLDEAMRSAAEMQATIYPSLLAIASLCALAVAWWLWRRVTVKDRQPLNPLREFRFRDELIWVLVLAVVLLVLPLPENTTRVGTNLAIFMGALYALRGIAVMTVFYATRWGAPGALFGVMMVLLTVALFPMMAAATTVIGVGDTWLDWRARMRPLPSSN